MKDIQAHHCKESATYLGIGKHYAAEHRMNPHIADRDRCSACLRRILYAQHSTLPGTDWISLAHLREWP